MIVASPSRAILLLVSSTWRARRFFIRCSRLLFLVRHLQSDTCSSCQFDPEIPRTMVFNSEHPLSKFFVRPKLVVLNRRDSNLLCQWNRERIAFVPAASALLREKGYHVGSDDLMAFDLKNSFCGEIGRASCR